MPKYRYSMQTLTNKIQSTMCLKQDNNDKHEQQIEMDDKPSFTTSTIVGVNIFIVKIWFHSANGLRNYSSITAI